ncbi:hypothetical protein D3C87_1916580 [compost metagenome]
MTRWVPSWLVTSIVPGRSARTRWRKSSGMKVPTNRSGKGCRAKITPLRSAIVKALSRAKLLSTRSLSSQFNPSSPATAPMTWPSSFRIGMAIVRDGWLETGSSA